jgi:hemolysin activation/secretion protein
MLSTRNPRFAVALSFSFFSISISAQTLPDAGSLRKQIEQQRTLPLPAARPQSAPLPPAISPPVGVTITVKSFHLVGNNLLSSEQLSQALAAFAGRDLDFAGLQSAADAVAAAYRQAGWIVRAYLPEQDVSEGTITLQVIEARFGGLRHEGEPAKRVKPADIQAYFDRQQKKGALLNANALDRALLLADDLPGVSVSGTLVQGLSEGETALALQSTDEAGAYGDITLDNTGARSTGSTRLTGNLNVNSPIGHGELLNLTALHTQGSDYGRLGLTVPIEHNGLRLGWSASAMRYKVIDGPNNVQSLGIKGNSGSVGIDISYPLVRSRLHNIYLTGAVENKNFYSENNNKSTDPKSYADYETNSVRLGLSGNRFDDLGGGGANSGSLQWQASQLAKVQAHSLIDSIGRSYNKVNYSLSRQQTLNADHSLLLSLQGQHATQLLDSSEKFYLGGAGSVRAYPTSELSGERGQLLTAEWRWRLNASWVISAFVDQGRVVTLPTAASDAAASLQLRGHGLSAAWQGPMGLNARVSWSRRDGNNPKPTSSGTDGDGTLQKDRIWLNASLPF